MTLVQITPGAGGMYCGNCFRDNALVAQFRKLGHSTLMVPLYLPMTLDEMDQSQGIPVFFNGINVYLEQKSPFFRHAPHWLHRLIASPRLLKWVAAKAAKTRAADVGDLTLSILRGEEGNQARELEQLIGWLKSQPAPDAICLSNGLLIGLAKRLESELGAPVVCMLQGEDSFLDQLPEPDRAPCWKELADRARDVAALVAPSQYYASLMERRLGIEPGRIQVVHNGINQEGYSPALHPPDPPVLGYFARMCPEKGLDTLVDAYILLRQQKEFSRLRLHVGGGCGPGDEAFVQTLKDRLRAAGVLPSVEFHPNLDRPAKQEFLRNLSVFSVPAAYGEAFGLYIIEALASGVPVVQPAQASFPELIVATRGGLVYKGGAQALAETIARLLSEPDTRRACAAAGLESARQHFTVERMCEDMLRVFQRAASSRTISHAL